MVVKAIGWLAVYLIRRILRQAQDSLSWLSLFIDKQVMDILNRDISDIETDDPDKASAFDPPVCEEGSILGNDYAPGTWIVLAYTPGEGYLLSDDNGVESIVSWLDVELFFYVTASRSHQRRHRN